MRNHRAAQPATHRASPPTATEHPAALSSFRNWLRILRHGGDIDRQYIPRALFVCVSTLATSPLRLWEQLRYTRQLRDTTIHPSPVVIIGHWRTGTTHLQNLMSQDETFAFVTTFQALAPGFCLTGDRLLKPLLARFTARRYPTRLIDNIPLLFDSPQEDEFALANLTPHSVIHAFTFPRQTVEVFERSVLFDGHAPDVRTDWVDTYLRLLRKTTLAGNGKRLLIKNCAHSGRLPALLDLFPDAKFIHIVRNPYYVFRSTVHMHRTVHQRSQLQSVGPERVTSHVLEIYERLMQRFLADRSLIPSENLVEIRYEDLERAPIDQLHAIYRALDLPGYENAEPAFQAYINSVSGYRKNRYTLDPETIETVNRHWAFALDEWGYERLEPQQPPSSRGLR